MKYTVVEIQNGVVGENVWTYDTIDAAESKYHSILAVAAVSTIAVHSAVILNETGYCVRYQCYTHEVGE